MNKILDLEKTVDVIRRIIATFATSALGIIGGAAVIGDIPVYKSALLAGFVAVAQVIERLARFSMDGNLTQEEIDVAFLGEKARSSEDAN